MRISDWSSDVCSSDLADDQQRHALLILKADLAGALQRQRARQPLAVAVGLDEIGDHRGGRLQMFLHRGERVRGLRGRGRSEEHTSELQSLMRISYAVFCLKKKNKGKNILSKTTPKDTTRQQ